MSVEYDQTSRTLLSIWNAETEGEITTCVDNFISSFFHQSSCLFFFGKKEGDHVVIFRDLNSAPICTLSIHDIPINPSPMIEPRIGEMDTTPFLSRLSGSESVLSACSVRTYYQNPWFILFFYSHTSHDPSVLLAHLDMVFSHAVSALSKLTTLQEERLYYRYLESINQLKPITDSNETLHTALRRILSTVEEMFHAEAGIMLFDPKDEQLVLQSPAFRAKEEEINLYRLPVSQIGNASRVFLTGKPYFSNQAIGDNNIIQQFVDLYKVKNICTVPIEGNGNRIGVLHVINRRDRAWIEDDLKTLCWISSKIANIIINARLVQEITEQRAMAEQTAKMLQQQKNIIEKQAEQLKKQSAELSEALSLHHFFTDILIKGEGLIGIIRTLADRLKRNVFLLDTYQRILALAMETEEPGIQPTEGEEETNHVYQIGEYFNADSKKIRIPLNPMGKKLGTLVIFNENQGKLTPLENTLIEQAKLVLCLELMHERNVREKLQNKKSDILLRLINGNIQDKQSLAKEIVECGLNLQTEHILFAIKPETDGTNWFPSENEDNESMSQFYNILQDIFEQNRIQSIISSHVDHLILALPKKQFNEKFIFNVDQLYEFLLKEIKKRANPLPFRIGMSRPSSHLSQYPHAYQEAIKALAVARGLDRRAININDIKSMEILLDIDAKSSREFVFSILGPLLEHGKTRGDSLVRTLHEYIQSNGNLAITAERCFTHINTVRYRLKKIEQLLGRNLKDAETLFELHIALKLYLLQQNYRN